MQEVTKKGYHKSSRTRLAVLFTPIRLALFIGALLWCLAFNALLIGADGKAAWAGPVSVLPIFAFTIWTYVTDARNRRAP